MAVSFAKDIVPLFRPIDIKHMQRFGMPLDDHAFMSDPAGDHKNARDVQDSLANKRMPPGGPFWTPEQLALFDSWMKDGFPP